MLMVVAVLALALAAFFVGWFLGSRHSENAALPEPTIPSATAPTVPMEDVPGAEVPELPRYPGSVRIEYEREELGNGLVETDVEYATTDGLEDVQSFYRRAFEGANWNEVDFGVFQGEFFYFVTKGEREAVIEIEERAEFTEIEIELVEPLARP